MSVVIDPLDVTDPAESTGPQAGAGGAATVVTLSAALLVLLALVVPRDIGLLTPAAFLAIPVEALLGAALLLVLPARSRPAVARVLGAVLGLLTVLGLLHLGFDAVLGRPFDPVDDASLLGDAMRFLAGSLGEAVAIGAAAAAVVLAVGLPVVMSFAVLRLSRVVVRRRTAATRALAVLAPVWLACALLGAQLVPGVPVAAAGAASLARDTAVGIPASLRDRQEFAAQLTVDPFGDTPPADLLTALRGKDVVVVFVEAYGRDAVEDPEFAPQVGAVLDEGTGTLAASGFASRSGFLTSPVAGGNSWLAHATFGSGLRVSDQQRYLTLVGSERRTLSSAFADAGWHTVAVMPGTTDPWPEREFYGYGQLIDVWGLGYRGPDLGWATTPDQYTLSAFQRLVQDVHGSSPIMAEIALASSHAPWALIPPVLDWGDVGDGSVYHSLAEPGDPDAIWTEGTTAVRTEYRRSIEYSLRTVISWVQTYGDDDLVLLVLGDHQPLPLITGDGASHDVPITIVTRDRDVLDRISPWGWQDGLRPGAAAPVWPMESFRDRFLTTFGP